MNIPFPRGVPDPVYARSIDFRGLEPIVDHQFFQRLREVKQLGLTHFIYPGATHTRLGHCFGAMHLARTRIVQPWTQLGCINGIEARALPVAALLHDIGHPAGAHVSEPFCNHAYEDLSINGSLSLERLLEMRGVIEGADIDFDLVWKILSHKHPLSHILVGGMLTIDKLDYLRRDSYFTGREGLPGTDYILDHAYYHDGRIVFSSKAIEPILELQTFYLRMYKEVYLRKTSSILQRMFQKMLHLMIKEGELDPKKLPFMDDHELVGGMIFHSKHPLVQEYYRRMKERRFFQQAIVLRPKKFLDVEDTAGKHVCVRGMTYRDLSIFEKSPRLRVSNFAQLVEVEKGISSMLGLPEGSILIVPIEGTGRLREEDVIFADRDGVTTSLRKTGSRSDHFRNLAQLWRSCMTFRICAYPEHRETVSKPANVEKVCRHLFEICGIQA